jgi:hypothetical protein
VQRSNSTGDGRHAVTASVSRTTRKPHFGLAHIAGQGAYEACTRQHKKAKRPLLGEDENSKADHDTCDDREEDDDKQGERSRR